MHHADCLQLRGGSVTTNSKRSGSKGAAVTLFFLFLSNVRRTQILVLA